MTLPFHDGLDVAWLPEPRPVKDDQPCDRCRHPRWMHADGRPQRSCHFTNYGGNPENRCACERFVERAA